MGHTMGSYYGSYHEVMLRSLAMGACYGVQLVMGFCIYGFSAMGFSYGILQLWNFAAMEFCSYGILQLWNFPAMEFCSYGFRLWGFSGVLIGGHPFG